MYNIGYLLICEDIVKAGKNQTIILNPTNTIEFKEFPAKRKLKIVLSLVGDIKGVDYPFPKAEFKVIITDSKGEKTFESDVSSFTPPKVDDHDEFSFVAASLAMSFNVEFKATGLHKIEVLINDDKKKELLVPICKKTQRLESDDYGE
ncbi:hypothetical protein M3579_17240 [Bacillus pumilus]|uniref:DUF6941 family protein n=1 Tax=Bacillus pumilus TaxID=1408 RepID=UPI00203E087F|nr:hypothetical protein [Bacillus pumilus]MCM3037709.1 hypothetical protein [Bacillus pumilus]